ncbi:MAG: hypothetical protein WDN48_19930 [Pseudolabrys sp.]
MNTSDELALERGAGGIVDFIKFRGFGIASGIVAVAFIFLLRVPAGPNAFWSLH